MLTWNRAILFLWLSLGQATRPNPGPCTGVCTNILDPFIVRRHDGVYFRFSTGEKIRVHTAPAITGPWTFQGAALPRGSSVALAGNQDLWVSDASRLLSPDRVMNRSGRLDQLCLVA